jgi:hypothetical protein
LSQVATQSGRKEMTNNTNPHAAGWLTDFSTLCTFMGHKMALGERQEKLHVNINSDANQIKLDQMEDAACTGAVFYSVGEICGRGLPCIGWMAFFIYAAMKNAGSMAQIFKVC